MVALCAENTMVQTQTSWTAGTGNWNVSSNWDGGVPNSLTPAYIGNGGTAQISTAGAVAEHAYLGILPRTRVAGYKRRDARPAATQSRHDGSWRLRQRRASINSGGKLTDRFSYVGRQENSDGNATVTGTNSSWTSSEGFDVGLYGYGWLAIQNAGTVSYTYAATPAYLGYAATGSGTIVVDGTNSNFTSSADLFVGNSGIGWMYLQNGGKATNVNGDIAFNSGSFGTVSVNGTGSTWTNNSVVAVGVSGTAEAQCLGRRRCDEHKRPNWTRGRLQWNHYGYRRWIELDGQRRYVDRQCGHWLAERVGWPKVTNVNGNLGVLAGSLGVVTVSGPGSWWKNNSVVAVGVSVRASSTC